MKRYRLKRVMATMLSFTMLVGSVKPINAENRNVLENATVSEEVTVSENTISGNSVSENDILEEKVNAEPNETSGPEIYVGEGYEVIYKVDSQWHGAFNGSITITNTSEEVIDNWMIEFDFIHEITNIWNAKIGNYNNGKYVIKNDSWNQDIQPGASVNFGFQASYQEEIVAPDSYKMLGSYQPVVTEAYSVDYVVNSAWGTQTNASITITNHSAEVIEDWQLAFDMNAEITNIWNGCIMTGVDGEYLIKNAGYNANI